eukprot:GHVS01007584.1.p1 GENE.GHVS01007584.1~~GHVS01007584.1.p1  ORF type:complete len:238 (-),score=45.10 GHVS01007584.1:312-1025(-)
MMRVLIFCVCSLISVNASVLRQRLLAASPPSPPPPRVNPLPPPSTVNPPPPLPAALFPPSSSSFSLRLPSSCAVVFSSVAKPNLPNRRWFSRHRCNAVVCADTNLSNGGVALAFINPFSKIRKQTQMIGALFKQLEPREPTSGINTGDPSTKSEYAVISIPLEFSVHRSAYDAIANLPMFMLRLERLLLRSVSLVATSVGLAIALPRLVHQFGGLTLSVLPPVLVLLLPFTVAVLLF